MNVIDTVEAIKRALGPLQAAIPRDIHVTVLSDRTLTIRAAVRDVEFTLMLTVALVVMVIFVFLRSVWTTVIPAVTIPLALLGACALMWAVGYSLDNLSLMAFTIAVGFVVDDAIVMLENITRHIEEGERPFEAALKGSAEIGFTIISMSASLIAVLIPLLMMSGLIGRLFREFSVTIAMTIAVSAFVSLTLSPMMASRFLKSRDEERHGRLYKLSERGFTASRERLRARARFRPAPSLRHAHDVRGYRDRDGLFVRRDSEGLLPATGHRHSLRDDRGGAGHLVSRNVPAAGRGRKDRPGRPRGRRRSGWGSAPASAARGRTRGACSSPSSPRTSATSAYST